MNEPKQADAVDRILAQWRQERPDLDTSVMGPIGRIKRCAALLHPRLEATFSRFGLSHWEFDVLATLRRSGDPFCLAPTALFSALMVSSGTMTHRLQRLESSGLVQRLPNVCDARSMLVQLTPEGRALIDRAVEAHVANEHEILAALPTATRQALDELLSAMLVALEGAAPAELDPKRSKTRP